MSDLSKLKKGDKVYSLTAGWGKVIGRIDDVLQVDFGHKDTYEYTIDGKADQDDIRAELYTEVMTVIPKTVLSND